MDVTVHVEWKISVVIDILIPTDLIILRELMMMKCVMKVCTVMKQLRWNVLPMHSVSTSDMGPIHVSHVSRIIVRQTVIMVSVVTPE